MREAKAARVDLTLTKFALIDRKGHVIVCQPFEDLPQRLVMTGLVLSIAKHIIKVNKNSINALKSVL